MPVCSIVKLLPLGTVDDLMHYCIRPSASGNSASGGPRHLRVIVLTILQTGMKKLYNIVLLLVSMSVESKKVKPGLNLGRIFGTSNSRWLRLLSVLRRWFCCLE